MDSKVFDDIIGQDKALGLIKSALASGSAAHAYIFTGPAGVGKTMAAVRFAAALNCDNNGCGICSSCVKILKGAHPDVELVEAQDNVLRIAQVRNISRSIGLKPFEGRRKVYIVRNVNTTNAESANALLKDLEEPPAHVTFILTAPGVEGLLPTVVSRCQEVVYAGVPVHEMKRLLIDEYRITEEKSEVMAALSGGSVAKALVLSEAGEEAGLRDFILDNTGVLKRRGVLAVFELKDKIMSRLKSRDKHSGVKPAAEVVDVLASWYRDILVIKETGDESLIVNKDRAAEVVATAESYTFDELTGTLDVLTETAGYIRTNANKELLLEYALLTIGDI